MKMLYNYNVVDQLQKRQTFVGDYLTPSYFSNQIIKTCYDSCDYLYETKKVLSKTKQADNLVFSKDGNLMAAGHSIWKMNEELSFPESTKIVKVKLKYLWADFCINQNSSIAYVYTSYYGKRTFRVYDLVSGRLLIENFKRNSFHQMSSCPFNPNIMIHQMDNRSLCLFDLRTPETINEVKKMNSILNSLEFNPGKDNSILVVPNDESEIFTFDLRNKQVSLFYQTLYYNENSRSYAEFNRKGDKFFLLRSKSGPLLFDVNKSFPILEFDDFGYNCGVVVKDCCFGGPNDEFLIASSDDTNVFVWEIPKDNSIKDDILINKVNSAKFVLKQPCRTSTVNYNYARSVLACSEYNPTVRFWSIFSFKTNLDQSSEQIIKLSCLTKKGFNRCIYKNTDYLYESFHPNPSKLYYFKYDFETFLNIHSPSFIEEFKNDLNIIYIKNFIDHYSISDKVKEIRLFKELRNTFFKNRVFDKRVLNYQYLSVGFELIKFFMKHHDIETFIFYLKEQLMKIKSLKNKIMVSKEEFNNHIWLIKKNDLKRIKLILKLMLVDLQIIIFQGKLIYFNWFTLSNKFLEIFIKSRYCSYKRENRSFLSKQKNLKWAKYREYNKKLIKISQDKKRIFKFKNKSFKDSDQDLLKKIKSNLLDQYTNQSLFELRENFFAKKEKLKKVEKKNKIKKKSFWFELKKKSRRI